MEKKNPTSKYSYFWLWSICSCAYKEMGKFWWQCYEMYLHEPWNLCEKV